jgi:hypothetical protein
MQTAAVGFAAISVVAALAQTGQDTRMEITVEKKDGAHARVMDPGHVFDPGDLVRFRFKSNLRGYLYVVDRSTSGSDTLLFPTTDSGMDNRIERAREYRLPSTANGWFEVKGPAGHDVVYWVVSPVEFPAPAKAAVAPIPTPPPSKPGELPPGMTPRCDDTIFRARGDCVDVSAGAKPVEKPGTLPDNLAQMSGAAARELVFIRKQNSSVVSTLGPLDGPAIYEFRLAHK